MKFLCYIYANRETEHLPAGVPARRLHAYRKSTATIRKRGHPVAYNLLLPPGLASTIRMRGFRVSATDGPYVETKEQLGESTPRSQHEVGGASHAA
jgi:hypothetical protein